jgi:hypothetical protein
VVDSGPLISLAACGRLGLLGSFSRPIRIADVARAECVRDLEKVGASRLADRFSGLDRSTYTVVDRSCHYGRKPLRVRTLGTPHIRPKESGTLLPHGF